MDWRCRDGWFFRTGMCFKFLSHATIPWKTAQQLCQQNGGTLPIIRDQEMLVRLLLFTSYMCHSNDRKNWWTSIVPVHTIMLKPGLFKPVSRFPRLFCWQRITGELVEEDKTLSSTSTFWLGLRRDDTTSEYIWEDGSAFRHHEWYVLFPLYFESYSSLCQFIPKTTCTRTSWLESLYKKGSSSYLIFYVVNYTVIA